MWRQDSAQEQGTGNVVAEEEDAGNVVAQVEDVVVGAQEEGTEDVVAQKDADAVVRCKLQVC